MRSLGLWELGLLARVLRAIPHDARRQIARQILAEVEVAAGHLRCHRRAHPQFGDGSLMARCLSLSPTVEPCADDPEFLASVIVACEALRDHSRL